MEVIAEAGIVEPVISQLSEGGGTVGRSERCATRGSDHELRLTTRRNTVLVDMSNTAGRSSRAGCSAPRRRSLQRPNSPADRFMRRVLHLPEDEPRASAAAARTAFRTSIMVATVRCLLMYIVLPFVLPDHRHRHRRGPGDRAADQHRGDRDDRDEHPSLLAGRSLQALAVHRARHLVIGFLVGPDGRRGGRPVPSPGTLPTVVVWVVSSRRLRVPYLSMALVCSCYGVNSRRSASIARGAVSIEAIGEACQAGTCCLGCHPTLDGLIQDARPRARRPSPPVRLPRRLTFPPDAPSIP